MEPEVQILILLWRPRVFIWKRWITGVVRKHLGLAFIGEGPTAEEHFITADVRLSGLSRDVSILLSARSSGD